MRVYKIGDLIANRYLVGHPPLRGGMGIVYLCYDIENGMPVALKTFQHQFLNAANIERFKQEAWIWVELERHPHVVRCLGVEKLEQQLFIIIEMITGPQELGADLSAWIHYHKLDLATALDFAIQICRGMRHAQAKLPGLVHRDLKPHNILVTQDHIAKVTDFGLAKAVQATGTSELRGISATLTSVQHMLSLENGIVGTPPYMPPEQWRGEDLDIRADIYAFGCVLYEMLSARLAFEVDFIQLTPKPVNEWLLMWRELHEQASPPELPSYLPQGVREVVYCCLAKNRNARYANFGAVETALTAQYEQVTGESPRAPLTDAELQDWELSNKGLNLAILDRHQEALAIYDKVLAVNPNDVITWVNKGFSLGACGRYQEALAAAEQALALDPTRPIAWSNKGYALRELGRSEEASVANDHALSLDSNSVLVWSNRGAILSSLGRWEEALAACERALTIDPGHIETWINKGTILANLNQQIEALAAYEQALSLDSRLAFVWVEKGNLLHSLEQRDKALAAYNQALTVDPNRLEAWLHKGVILNHLGKQREAISAFEQALFLDSANLSAWLDKGKCLEALDCWAEAIDTYDHLLALDPSNIEAWLGKGRTLDGLGRHEEALSAYNQALSIDPANALSWANKGGCLVDLGRGEEALAACERALDLDHTNMHAWNNKVASLCLLGQWWEALAACEQALVINPSNANALINKGNSLAKLGRYEEALVALDQALANK